MRNLDQTFTASWFEKAEREAIRRGHHDSAALWHDGATVIKSQATRISELEAALDRYGKHTPECELDPDDPDRDDPHCTCGLCKALLGEGEAK